MSRFVIPRTAISTRQPGIASSFWTHILQLRAMVTVLHSERFCCDTSDSSDIYVWPTSLIVMARLSRPLDALMLPSGSGEPVEALFPVPLS